VLLLPLLLPVVFSAYSSTQALNQLYLSYAAYCPETNISLWNCYFCKNVNNFRPVEVIYDSLTNIQGYVGISGSVGQVIFRGTQSGSLTNWIADLSAATLSPYVNIPNANVHSGFLAAWESVKPGVESAVQTLINTYHPTSFYFSGHSLGAALALLAALEIGPTLGVPFTVYNFGEPRVGNTAFAQWYDAHIGNIYRVVNEADCVPHLPTISMGFWHSATEIWYKTATNIITCSSSTGEDPNCSDSLLLPISTSDHTDYLSISLSSGSSHGCS